MLFPLTALMGCVRLVEVLSVDMNQRYPSFIQITYCSLSLCLWMKYTSQVIHIHAFLQTTTTSSDKKQHSHLPREDTIIFQSLSFFPFSLMKLITWKKSWKRAYSSFFYYGKTLLLVFQKISQKHSHLCRKEAVLCRKENFLLRWKHNGKKQCLRNRNNCL